jgi:hypothetical protein
MGGGSIEGTRFESLVIGGISGSIAEICVMPPFVIRTRMMVQGAAAKSSSVSSYTSFLDAGRTMYRTEGIRSFYKGLGVNAIFTPFARGLYMVGMEVSKQNLGEGTALLDFASGMNAQLLSSIAYVPRDIIVERCAIDGQIKSLVGSTASSVKALRTIFTAEGVGGFFRAFVPHQLVWVPFNGLFLMGLGKCKQFENEVLQVDSSGYAIGVANTFLSAGFAAVCTNPIDVVKTRLQVAGANSEIFGYKGPIDCVTKLLREEGPKALFSGLTGRFLYAGPGFAIFLPTYDLLKKLYFSR